MVKPMADAASIDERCVNVARRSELGGDAAAGNTVCQVVGPAWPVVGPLVSSSSGLVGGRRGRPGGVTVGGQSNDQRRSADAVVVEGEP